MNQSYFYRPNQRLSYAEYGPQDGFPLLIQHGMIASIEQADLFERLIQRGARLICMARPGYGDSSPYAMDSFAEWAQIAGGLIEFLRLERFDILGISSGAPYAYAIASQLPEQTRNLYIFSGIPALYDEAVRAAWPYPTVVDQTQAQAEALAHELFFANLTPDDLSQPPIRDSLRNHGFGVAQDLILRFKAWGFRLSDVRAQVFMRHSKTDDSVPYPTAVRTAALLPHCQLELLESGPHFSKDALEAFIDRTMLPAAPRRKNDRRI
jgi:pimeloyl-ACP methyl ester carboxylesterase